MKTKHFFLTLAFLCFSANMLAKQTYSIKEAMDRNLVSVQISGITKEVQGEGKKALHFGECIALTIQNNTSQDFTVSFEAGRLLKSLDTNFQIMLITKSQDIPMAAKETKRTKLFAMCSQKKKFAPNSRCAFAVSSMANRDIVAMAKFIEKKNCQTWEGQQAVWALTDNSPVEHLGSSSNEIHKALFNEVFRIKKTGRASVSKKIGFQTDFKKEGTISIKIFDASGKLVQHLLKNTASEAGLMSYNFWVKECDFEPGPHKVVLFYNGILTQEQELVFE